MRPIRIAVIGLGFGRAVHIPVFQSLIGDVEVVAVVGSEPKKAQVIAQQLGVTHSFANYQQLETLDLDAVSVALPPSLSGPVIKWAVDRGIHVLAEKPLSNSVAEIQEILSSIEAFQKKTPENNFVGMCDFQFVELPAFQHLIHELDSRLSKDIKFIRINWMVQSYAEEKDLLNWKRSLSQGGGVLNILGSHLLYYVEHLFGQIIRVHATDHDASIFKTDSDFDYAENAVSLNLWMEFGAKVDVFITNSSSNQMIHDIDIYHRDGRIRLINETADYMGGFELGIWESDKPKTVHFTEKDGREVAFQKLAKRFVRGVQSARRSPVRHSTFQACPSLADGYRVQVLIDRVRESIISGETISVAKS